VAVVSLQPGLRLADVKVPGLPTLRARTAREAAASEARRSPLNGLVVAVLLLAAIALLPLWRPLGPAGVPAGVLSHAPQRLTWILSDTVAGPGPPPGPDAVRVWTPQLWSSWFEFSIPVARVGVDSRIELFPQAVWAEAEQVATGTGDWQAILDRYAVQILVVAPEQEALRAGLGASGDWVLYYDDGDGSIWVLPQSR
jgi:hypothetical protein